MSRASFLDQLIGGYFDAPSTNPRPIEKQELLRACKITERRLKYFISRGAVIPPIGTTRGASYTSEHLAQVKRATDLVRTKGLTVAQVAELYARGRKAMGQKRESPTLRPTRSTQENVYRLTEGVRIVAAGELLPSERALLKRLLKTGEATFKERTKLLSEVLARDSGMKQALR